MAFANWARLVTVWSTPEQRERALAELGDRETNPAAIARIEKQKAALAAWELQHARQVLDALDDAERNSMFAPWRQP
jgi:hypothetical protein